MDNINDILSSLSDEDIKRLTSVANEIMGSAENKSTPSVSPDSDDIAMLLKVKDIMNTMNSKGSKNADLLAALKPHLSDKSRAKADSAARMLRLFELLPLMKDLF